VLQVDYCKKVVAKLKEREIRAEVLFGERLSKLIRNAETQKIPVMAVVGPKEVESDTLTVRTRHGGELGTITVDELASRIQLAVSSRGLL
jgi:threonyl-tRNA synthetase